MDTTEDPMPPPPPREVRQREARPPAPPPAHAGLDAARSALRKGTISSLRDALSACADADFTDDWSDTVEDVCQKAVEMATACRRGPREKRDPPAKLLGGCCRVLEKALQHKSANACQAALDLASQLVRAPPWLRDREGDSSKPFVATSARAGPSPRLSEKLFWKRKTGPTPSYGKPLYAAPSLL